MEQLLYHFIILHLGLVARKPDLVTREKQRHPRSHISIFVIRLLECLITKLASVLTSIFQLISVAGEVSLSPSCVKTGKANILRHLHGEYIN